MSRSEAFVDPPSPCRCLYCTNRKLRTFVDKGLNAARKQGLPRPKLKTVAAYITKTPDLPSPHMTTVRGWLEHCCTAWTDPWPGEGGDG